jgi:hypothetical protein
MDQNEKFYKGHLEAHLERVKLIVSTNKQAQYKTARWHHFWHYFLQIITIFLSLAVGTSLFASFENQFGGQTKLWLAITSFIAAFLGSAQIFLRLNELAVTYKSFATKFAEVERHIDFVLASPPEKLAEFRKAIEKINAEINVIAKEAPLIKNKEHEAILCAIK